MITTTQVGTAESVVRGFLEDVRSGKHPDDADRYLAEVHGRFYLEQGIFSLRGYVFNGSHTFYDARKHERVLPFPWHRCALFPVKEIFKLVQKFVCILKIPVYRRKSHIGDTIEAMEFFHHAFTDDSRRDLL